MKEHKLKYMKHVFSQVNFQGANRSIFLNTFNGFVSIDILKLFLISF